MICVGQPECGRKRQRHHSTCPTRLRPKVQPTAWI